MTTKITIVGRIRVLLGALLLIAALGKALNYAQTTVQDPDVCSVTLSGDKEPTVLPAHDVWEATFRRLRANPGELKTPLSGNTVSLINSRAGAALEKVAALRQSLSGGAGSALQAARDREQVIADTIVDARDDAARQTSAEDFDALMDFSVATARAMKVKLPAPGRFVTSEDHVRMCEVAVVGRDNPSLVPEHQVWAVEFNGWAKVAGNHMGADGQINREYLTAVQRSGVHASPEDLRTFLEAATRAAADLEELQREAASGPAEQAIAHDLKVQRLVMAHRHALLRAVSVEGWRAILQRVETTRKGTNIWFRSPPSN